MSVVRAITKVGPEILFCVGVVAATLAVNALIDLVYDRKDTKHEE